MPKLGSGARFRKLQNSIEKDVKPRAGETKKEAAGAIAASIGRKKFGNKRFQQLSAMGRKRK